MFATDAAAMVVVTLLFRLLVHLSFLVGGLTTPLTGLTGVQTVPAMVAAMALLSTAALIASRLLRTAARP